MLVAEFEASAKTAAAQALAAAMRGDCGTSSAVLILCLMCAILPDWLPADMAAGSKPVLSVPTDNCIKTTSA